MADQYDKLGILGERSVMRVLLQHSYRNLHAQGIMWYKLYSTRGTALQGKEIDLIEKWKDASGRIHMKGHEVKCENTTLNFDKTWLNDQSKAALAAAYSTGVEDPSRVKWACTPTGNYFIELVQSVDKKTAYACKAEYDENKSVFDVSLQSGWYWAFGEGIKTVKEYQDSDGDRFTDGRDIWFVSYTPKPDVQKTTVTKHTTLYCDPDTGEIGEKQNNAENYVLTAEPARGFMVMQLPDNGTHDQLDRYVFGGALYCSTTENKNTGKYSVGLLLPIAKLYPVFPTSDTGRIVSGYADKNSGAVLYNDLEVWANEKDVGEVWNAQDATIGTFEWRKEQG